MIMDQDQTLDQRPNALATDPPALPIILRSQAARHLAALSGREHPTMSDGSRIADLKAFTFQTFPDVEAEDGRRLVRVLHGSLNQHFETLSCGPRSRTHSDWRMSAQYLLRGRGESASPARPLELALGVNLKRQG